MGLQVLTMGLVFGLLFGSDTAEYLPFLSTGLIIWGFIANTLNEGCSAFFAEHSIIKQIRIPLIHFVLKVVWKNFLYMTHNLIILPVVFFVFSVSLTWGTFMLVPGFILLISNLIWVVWLLAIVSARFRDFPPIVNALISVAFYVTPIMWYPKLIENNQLAHFLLGFNPFYHWIQVVRLPMLGGWPTLENYALCLFSVIAGFGLTALIHLKYRNMIAYWV